MSDKVLLAPCAPSPINSRDGIASLAASFAAPPAPVPELEPLPALPPLELVLLEEPPDELLDELPEEELPEEAPEELLDVLLAAPPLEPL
jgi:hypothetical protein